MVKTVVAVEWPSMEEHRGRLSSSISIVARMCRASLTICWQQGWGFVGGGTRANIVGTLATLQACREARMADYSGHLPLMMWCVLLFRAKRL